MARLSRPIDSDTKYYKPKPMEMGLYKFQVKGFIEWGSNKDAGIKGAFEKLSEMEQEQVNVVSIVWTLACVDPPYEGYERRMWTTYWASPEKLKEVYDKKVEGYLDKNPTADESDAQAAVEPWRPQEAAFDFLFACGLMVKDDDREEYKPVGWELTEEGFNEACMVAVNQIVWGKIGPNYDGSRQDDLLSVSPVQEE